MNLYIRKQDLVIVWIVQLYGKIISVSYCMGCASIPEDNQC